jgi:hypothetical protein
MPSFGFRIWQIDDFGIIDTFDSLSLHGSDLPDLTILAPPKILAASNLFLDAVESKRRKIEGDMLCT